MGKGARANPLDGGYVLVAGAGWGSLMAAIQTRSLIDSLTPSPTVRESSVLMTASAALLTSARGGMTVAAAMSRKKTIADRAFVTTVDCC